MDARAQRKALFRSKLKEQKLEKRIDSPLVKYTEDNQPLCRVCNIILKSESLWPVHQASQKHHEAIESFKAAAAGHTSVKNINTGPQAELPKSQSSRILPADFFDNQDTKRQKRDKEDGGQIHSALPGGSGSSVLPNKKKDSSISDQSLMPEPEMNVRNEDKPAKLGQLPKLMDHIEAKQVKGALPENFFDVKEIHESRVSSQLSQAPGHIDNLEIKQVKGTPFDNKEASERDQSNQLNQTSNKSLDGSEPKQVKGTLPEGFFDNKDMDLRARGIEPVKVDIEDAYREFEKAIEDDLQEVDDRLEEEEIDVAETLEEFETQEQKAEREQLEMIKKQLMDSKAARLAKGKKSPAFRGKESSDESSSDEDDDEDFAVDWRAKHL